MFVIDPLLLAWAIGLMCFCMNIPSAVPSILFTDVLLMAGCIYAPANLPIAPYVLLAVSGAFLSVSPPALGSPPRLALALHSRHTQPWVPPPRLRPWVRMGLDIACGWGLMIGNVGWWRRAQQLLVQGGSFFPALSSGEANVILWCVWGGRASACLLTASAWYAPSMRTSTALKRREGNESRWQRLMGALTWVLSIALIDRALLPFQPIRWVWLTYWQFALARLTATAYLIFELLDLWNVQYMHLGLVVLCTGSRYLAAAVALVFWIRIFPEALAANDVDAVLMRVSSSRERAAQLLIALTLHGGPYAFLSGLMHCIRGHAHQLSAPANFPFHQHLILHWVMYFWLACMAAYVSAMLYVQWTLQWIPYPHSDVASDGLFASGLLTAIALTHACASGYVKQQ